MPRLPGIEGTPESPRVAVEHLLRLPAGQRVWVKFVVEKDGSAGEAEILKGLNPAIDAAVLAAVHQLPCFSIPRQAGQPVRLTLTLGSWPAGGPAETVTSFLWRVLPTSFAQADEPLSYAWRPSAYGLQLFFSAPSGNEPEEQYERNLFVLDPTGPATYAVRVFNVQQADYTTLEALFFADANHDGQKELLALTRCDLREYVRIDGQLMPGRFPHYQTVVIYFRGLDGAGRPRYEEQYREDLDELATAAEVRQTLAAPPHRSRKAPRRNPTAKAAK